MMSHWGWHSMGFGWLIPIGVLLLAAWLVIMVANRNRHK